MCGTLSDLLRWQYHNSKFTDDEIEAYGRLGDLLKLQDLNEYYYSALWYDFFL